MQISLYPNEMVIKAADTTHLRNGEGGIQGKLILTNQRVYFKTLDNKNNGQSFELLPEEIQEVMPFKNRLFFPTGMNIVTREGREMRFLVSKRNDWIEMIVRLC